jgi:hypothetical protein
MNKPTYNNIGIGSLGIAFVLQTQRELPIAKTLLILPLISNSELLNHLANNNSRIRSLDKLIIEKPNCFSNFNKRYYDSLCTSIEAIQLLNEIGLIKFKSPNLASTSPTPYNQSMGRRAEKIHKAANNIGTILIDKTEKLYLNLRIEL